MVLVVVKDGGHSRGEGRSREGRGCGAKMMMRRTTLEGRDLQKFPEVFDLTNGEKWKFVITTSIRAWMIHDLLS